MAVEIREHVGSAATAAEEKGVKTADLVSGATAATIETVGHPVRAIRKLERKGAPINADLRRNAVRRADATAETLEAYRPEQILLGGLRLVRERARRKDLLGTLAFRALEVINDGLGAATTVVKRMERASTPPSRGAVKTPIAPSVRQARTTVRKASVKSRGTARRATARARRTERKAAGK